MYLGRGPLVRPHRRKVSSSVLFRKVRVSGGWSDHEVLVPCTLWKRMTTLPGPAHGYKRESMLPIVQNDIRITSPEPACLRWFGPPRSSTGTRSRCAAPRKSSGTSSVGHRAQYGYAALRVRLESASSRLLGSSLAESNARLLSVVLQRLLLGGDKQVDYRNGCAPMLAHPHSPNHRVAVRSRTYPRFPFI
jgi:hypothetical protein